jgi:hypothetical protein
VADEYDWKVALDAIFDTEPINGPLNTAIDILHLFIQGQRKLVGIARVLPGAWTDIEPGQTCTVDEIADVLFGIPSGKLFPDYIQEVAVVFNQAGVAGNEEDQDASVGRVESWRRNGILDFVGADHCM